ncbi:hybrid sensor histidine kinase/response regulator [Aquisphaera insulae]|uniref:hybrid sensor histidine kinase/response regulator n=1 Tax=Aquisphaera insulae TaxID=2712864 RepID=UPI0013ECC12E|nr:ATP-binding protein [Aquisphaera insulae]
MRNSLAGLTPPSLQPISSYGGAAILVVLAASARVVMGPALGSQFPFMPFFFALIIAAWLGGMGASFAALILSLAAVPLVVAPLEKGAGSGTRPAGLVDGASVAMGLVATLVGGGLRTSQSRAAVSLRLFEGEQRRTSDEVERRRVAEEKVELFRGLAQSMPQIVWICRGSKVEFTNRRWAEYTGRTSEEETLADAWKEVIHPDDLGRVEAALARSEASGAEFNAEYRLRDAAGIYRWFQGRSILGDGSGRVVLRFGSALDIDDRRRAERGVRFLAAVGAALANMHEESEALREIARLSVPDFADWCIVHVRDQGTPPTRIAVVHSEPRRARMADEFHGRSGIGPEAIAGTMRVLRTGQPELVDEVDEDRLAAVVDLAGIDPAGREAALGDIRRLGLRSSIAVPLRGREGPLGVMTFLATESRRPYDDVDLRLALDVSDRAAKALENARLVARIELADRRKDEFLAILAHELRNPLAPIHNALMLMGSPGIDLDAERSLAMRMVSHLARLVEDLVDVSRLTRGRIVLRRQVADLRPIIEGAVEAATGSDREWQTGVSVSLPRRPILVNVDPERIGQILWNLLDNAIKYTGAGGRVALKAEVRGGEVAIRVADTGVGIPEEILPNIFEMFYRAEAPRGVAQGGLGIGLCLVKSLAELHGGTIEARSEGAGRGSEFLLTLPLAPVRSDRIKGDPPREPAAVATEPTDGRRRILVVDDNRDAGISLARLLEAMDGHDVRVAHDGPTALDIARDFRPEIAILDIGMPVMDGLELARRFRADANLGRTRLLALSGWGQEQDRERSHQAGFDRHLVKPVNLDELREALARKPGELH